MVVYHLIIPAQWDGFGFRYHNADAWPDQDSAKQAGVKHLAWGFPSAKFGCPGDLTDYGHIIYRKFIMCVFGHTVALERCSVFSYACDCYLVSCVTVFAPAFEYTCMERKR